MSQMRNGQLEIFSLKDVEGMTADLRAALSEAQTALTEYEAMMAAAKWYEAGDDIAIVKSPKDGGYYIFGGYGQGTPESYPTLLDAYRALKDGE